MKKLILLTACWSLITGSFAQIVSQQLQRAFQQFEADPQMKHATSSLYVIDANTGKVVFDKNSQVGLAPGSTQKIITAATAFELLGKDYRYKTALGYAGGLNGDSLDGFIFIRGSGDPTFGSWRYEATKPEIIYGVFAKKITDAGIKKISNTFYVDEEKFDPVVIPDGWIWQDIGNYYGAGVWGLNWKENQFDLVLKSDNKVGGPVSIVSKNGEDGYSPGFRSELKAAGKGTGDNAYIYMPVVNDDYVVKGTIPISQNNFKISGATNDAPHYFVDDLRTFLEEKKILNKPGVLQFTLITKMITPGKTLYTHYSPSLDSIIYWFLQKSINLYGEALIKTLAYEKKGFGSTDSGMAIVKDFWKQKGIDEDELNIGDGSGLSPQNRVTTHAEVEILKYAKKQSWFPYFYDALPEYNNMKMKSGTIKNVKGFCGYHKAANGKEYIFSFLVNNYNSSTSDLVGKMYRVLNELK